MSFVRPELLWLALLALPEILIAARRAPALRASLEALAGPRRRGRAGAAFAALSLCGAVAGALFALSAAIAVSGPSWGRRGAAVERAGLEASLVLDVSRSMEAKDMSPSRLEAARSLLRGLAHSSLSGAGAKGGREEEAGAAFAVVAAKGDGVLLVPMTEDLDALDAGLDYATPEAMTSRGTDLERGVAEGIKAFGGAGAGSRYLVLVTDGGELSGAVRRSVEAIRAAHARLIVVGMGGTEPAPVPGPGGAPLVDSSGKPLRSSQDSARLRSLAAAAEGRYLDGSDPKTPAALLAELAPSRRAGPKLEYQSVDRTGLFSALCLLFLAAAIAAEILATRGGRR